MRLACWVAIAMLAGPALAAASGRVVGPDGAAVPGAEICEFADGAAQRCVKADVGGAYHFDSPSRPTLLVRASGFVARVVDAAPLNAPVELRRAAVLSVKVVDAASGQPLSSGKVMLDAPSGQRIGDFVPFNRGGVRISTLEPGVVFVRASAEGYEPGGPLPVDLVGGAERSLRIPMTKSHGPAR